MDRKVFYDNVRLRPFGGSLSASQVTGLEAILAEAARRKTPIFWLAYMLATTFHETARAMQPIIESRQPSEANNPSVDQAIARLERSWAAGKMPWVKTAYWRKDADGKSWLGRGLPQVTHKRNYEMVDKKLGLKGALVRDPNLMFDPAVAVPTLFRGMEEGWFTARKLTPVVDDKPPYRDWRKIINGTESDTKVAGYAVQFETALHNAGYGADMTKTTPVPAQPVAPPTPAPAPIDPPPLTWLEKIRANFKKVP